MCDQDHFDEDRNEYEALGLVTRRQFGVLVGAGMSLMLPQVANAVAVNIGHEGLIAQRLVAPLHASESRRVVTGS